MDLTYGSEYERFRGEVREFLATHRDAAPTAARACAPKKRARGRSS